MRLAAELRIPLVTVIDTAGAALSRQAEEGGLAGHIARCIAEMVALAVPTISVLLGQGTGGAALALLPADRILAAQHGWLSPLPPEGASAILHHDTSHAPAMAAKQGIRSSELLAHGVVDRVIPEFPDAAEEPESFCFRVGAVLRHELAALGDRRRPPQTDRTRATLRPDRPTRSRSGTSGIERFCARRAYGNQSPATAGRLLPHQGGPDAA
jgi:acetyl-CoA carboxylase carboxyl transferase subunit beta